jgi:hypothetical protein
LLHDPKKDTIIQMTAEKLRGLLAGNPVAMRLLAKDCLRRPSQLVRQYTTWGKITMPVPVMGMEQSTMVQPGKTIQKNINPMLGGEL